MPQTDPRQGFTGLPLYPETYQIPDTLAALYFFLLDRSIEQYPTLSALQAAIPSPTDGMVKWVTADQCAYVRSGGAWVVLWAARSWTSLAPVSGYTGFARWKASPDGDSVEAQFDITPSTAISGDSQLTSEAIPATYRPSGTFPIVAAASYIEPSAARAQAIAYVSSTGLIRATSPGTAATRFRGHATWKLG